MTACDGYLPVPTIEPRAERAAGDDERIRVHDVHPGARAVVTAAAGPTPLGVVIPPDEVDDLDLVSLVTIVVVVAVALDDVDVVLDRDEAGIDVQCASSALIVTGPAISNGSPFSRIVKVYLDSRPSGVARLQHRRQPRSPSSSSAVRRHRSRDAPGAPDAGTAPPRRREQRR